MRQKIELVDSKNVTFLNPPIFKFPFEQITTQVEPPQPLTSISSDLHCLNLIFFSKWKIGGLEKVTFFESTNSQFFVDKYCYYNINLIDDKISFLDAEFIQTGGFMWRTATITAISCVPLYIWKFLRKRFSPTSYQKLS